MFCLVYLVLTITAVSTADRVPLILFGVDGYGYELYKEYGDKTATVVPIKTVFPSKTFPNFYSISTGLYPTQHGIISNQFKNQNKGVTFKYENEQNKAFDWYLGEPIWITAKKAGLRVYTDMWVGTGAEFGGIRPDYWSMFDATKTIEDKVTDLVENFDSADKCDFYVLYMNQPDHTLHRSDMADAGVAQTAIDLVESKISLLKTSLEGRTYNLAIVSDHGMAPYKTTYNLDKSMTDKADKFNGGPIAFWYTKPDDTTTEVVEDLNEYIADKEFVGVKAYDVSKMDKRFELCGLDGEGMPEIMLMMDEETAVNIYTQKSGHGYDNDYPSMYGMLRISGPGFKTLTEDTTRAVMNTELYNMFCSLLGIAPTSNTGTLDTFDYLLTSPPDRATWDYQQMSTPCSGARGLAASLISVILGRALL